MRHPLLPAVLLLAGISAVLHPQQAAANGNVYVSRFWHNHQPLYWPEWNSNGSQNQRGQYAWDSIVLKSGQNYGGLSPKQHPENDLVEIFGKDDRRNAYQFGPRNSLAGINNNGGFAISYSGSLIDNVRQLGAGGHLGYQGNWNAGIREARGWRTQNGNGSTRMDMLGFTSHHSLGPLLPKSVFRKEIQVFKQAWWKAWGGNSDLSDHSKGFFPTEMAYSRHLIDVLVDEGFEWTLVASHHISRTSPSYNDRANPTNNTYNIFSSPPNRADQISPRFDNVEQWWYGEPNPGNAAWNVAPFAYQLHRVKYVDPETGQEKKMYAVPSDDVLSYRYGYANEGVGKIDGEIAPHANVPVIVIPSTDGDNAWGGGASSWGEATAQLFGESAARGYKPSTPQDFVNAVKSSVTTDTHIEDGAWIFPEMCYGSPNFMKWIEPPVATVANRGKTTVPGTQIDMETPGFALKFYSFAPLMAGANWVETAEQIWLDESATNKVEAWKIQAPYDWDGKWTQPNDVELAWHIYLKGLDSGFNYYGGLGNDDEMKPGLATRRAVEKLQPWMTTARRNNDRTPPTVLKPQRFPYNPGGFTFGWFNQQPQIPNNAFLKRMNSEFYIWTHAYDLSGIPEGGVKLKIRIDNDGDNPLASNQNETYAGGVEVGTWVTLDMTKRVLPNTRADLNAAAANPGEIDYFLPTNEQADYYFVKITNTNLPNFRNKLLDYYIEATDARGNTHKSEIQHVYVEDFSGQTNGDGGGGGGGGGTGGAVTLSPTNPVAGQPLTVVYNPAGRVLVNASNVNIHHGFNQNVQSNWTTLPGLPMTRTNGTNWTFSYTVPANATTIALVFNNGSGTWDNNGGGNWNFSVSSSPPTNSPPIPVGLSVQNVTTNTVSLQWSNSATASSYIVYRGGVSNAIVPDVNFVDTNCLPDTEYTYSVAAVNVAGASSNSASVTARTLFLPVAATNIRIVTPSVSVTNSGTSVLFSGHAGLGLTNGLTWSNSANGQTGLIAFSGASNSSGWAWLTNITLANGSNAISFFSTYTTNLPLVRTGFDSPTNYSSWAAGSNSGTGFGPWSISNSSATNSGIFLADTSVNVTNFTDSAQNYGSTWTNGSGAREGFGAWSFRNEGGGAFLFGNPASAGIVGMSNKAFQLRGSGSSGNNFATAERQLSQPLQVGQTLSFLWGINWDTETTNGNKGFVLLSGTNEVVVVNNANTSNITFNSANTGFGYGTNAMRWAFKLLTTNSLQVTANDRDGVGTFTTNVSVTGAPSGLRFYAANMDTNSLREPYFDDFKVEGPDYINMQVGETKGFGLWAKNGGSVTATRNLPSPLAVGDVLTLRIDNNWIDTGARVGVALAAADGANRFNFYFTGGGTNYSIDDAVTGRNSLVSYTDNGLLLAFTMTGTNTYSLRTAGGVFTGTLASGSPITRLSVYNTNSGVGMERNFYVGEMSFSNQPTTNVAVSVAAPTITVSSAGVIPVDWWQSYNIAVSDRDPDADHDRDGFSNAQEHALGTDPTNSSSTFRITSIERAATNTTVTWTAVGGKTYQLQGKPALGSLSWSNMAEPVTAAANATNAFSQHGASTNQHFYRVRLVPE